MPVELKIAGTTLDALAVSAVIIPTCPAVVLPVFAPIALFLSDKEARGSYISNNSTYASH